MKNIDIKSVIIGALCTVIIFMFIGANSQNKNLGDIVGVIDKYFDLSGNLYA